MANLKTQGLKPGLLRQLGFFSATALVISNMVGTGIFATTGFMAGDLGSATMILACWGAGALFAFAGAGVGLHDRMGLLLRGLFGAHCGRGTGVLRLPGILLPQPEAG
ncbi:MAG: hypothetical protein ABSG79_20350 [Bryobacteraceae bacterium]